MILKLQPSLKEQFEHQQLDTLGERERERERERESWLQITAANNMSS